MAGPQQAPTCILLQLAQPGQHLLNSPLAHHTPADAVGVERGRVWIRGTTHPTQPSTADGHMQHVRAAKTCRHCPKACPSPPAPEQPQVCAESLGVAGGQHIVRHALLRAGGGGGGGAGTGAILAILCSRESWWGRRWMQVVFVSRNNVGLGHTLAWLPTGITSCQKCSYIPASTFTTVLARHAAHPACTGAQR